MAAGQLTHATRRLLCWLLLFSCFFFIFFFPTTPILGSHPRIRHVVPAHATISQRLGLTDTRDLAPEWPHSARRHPAHRAGAVQGPCRGRADVHRWHGAAARSSGVQGPDHTIEPWGRPSSGATLNKTLTHSVSSEICHREDKYWAEPPLKGRKSAGNRAVSMCGASFREPTSA